MSSSLSKLNFISSVAERDIDFILLEELEVSDAFRAWFSARVYETPVFKAHIGAWHSVSDAKLGESDLVFLFEATDGSRKSILVENKIDAPPQPDQGARYRKRGECGVEDGTWDEYRTCIVAPRRYLASSKNSEIYGAEVSYEEIMAHFVSLGVVDNRLTYRASLIREGIEQNRRGYQPKISDSMTLYVEEYVQYVRECFPELKVEEAKPRPAGSNWIMFYPIAKEKTTQILHQLTAGFVKVLLGGKAEQMDEYRKKYEDQPISELEVQVAGKSVGLVLQVPEIDPLTESFLESQSKVNDAMNRLFQARHTGELAW